MEIKTPTRFEPLKDGICEIYATDEQNIMEQQTKGKAYFDDRVVGYKRFFTAQAAQTKIDRIIRVQSAVEVTPEDRIVISGTRYQIEQIQMLPSTLPPCKDITLSQIGIKQDGN